MDSINTLLSNFIVWIGLIVVFSVAMNRFNNPQTMLITPSNWLDRLRNSFRWNPGQQNLMLRPARANTTIFRYRLYQFLYALLAVMIYLLVLSRPIVLEQMQTVISLFTSDGIPAIEVSGALVIAAFVILILPNVPPFHWADLKIRSMLYDRAMIPAQQLREMYRLKNAPYLPDENIIEQVRSLAVAEGFDANDIIYDNKRPTTPSLWGKSSILIKQIKNWEANDHYKTAFATLKEPDSEKRTVDVVKEMYNNLISDARVYFNELRDTDDEKTDELQRREIEFRSNCRTLLEKMYTLLAGVSLHSHYSDHERIIKFKEFGFKLNPTSNSPIPDSNDLLILTIILSIFLVLPLAYKLGLVKAMMIGAVMFSSVLTPIGLAHACPKLRDHKRNTHGPNVLYPVASGVTAAFLGYIIFFLGGQLLSPSSFCEFTGNERYLNCTYPWSFLHGGIAFLLALRLGVGVYPDIQHMRGIYRYRKWGNIKDAVICGAGMLIITAFIVVPLLDDLGRSFVGTKYIDILSRITLVSLVLGFIVPTWYRAQHVPVKKNRRHESNDRIRFEQELDAKRHNKHPA